MQLKKICLTLSLSIYLLATVSSLVKADCDYNCDEICGSSCGSKTCITGAEDCSGQHYGPGDPGCPPGQKQKTTCGASVDTSRPYWTPESNPDLPCETHCEDSSTGCACVQEKVDFWCGSCDPTPTPTPTSDPDNPDPTSNPTSTTSIISGRISADEGAAMSGPFCYQAGFDTLSFSGWNVSVTNTAAPSTTYTTNVSGGNFSVNTVNSGHTFTVTLDLSAQTGTSNYVCSCPAPLNPNNPYLCQYTGVVSPNNTVNFYLKEYNLSNDSWFQVFGGNFFGRTNIVSTVPYAFCLEEDGCQPALSVPIPSSLNLISSGFPISNTDYANNIVSYDDSSIYHSYLHLTNRPTNANSYDVSTDLSQVSYEYFYKLAENSAQKVGNGEDLEPLLSDWTNASWWSSSEPNYIKVDGNVSIDETQGFNLSSNQRLVVFVDGNLTFDDSNTGDSNRKITSVANGGFLAFFASGNILVTPNVGYELNPLSPSTPIVSNANSNVEGIFVADNNLIIQSKTAIGEVPPDRKFIGAGTFVGWNNVLLNRTFNDNNFGPILNNTQAIENFIYRPDLLANWPVKLKASTSNWREVDPQFIGQ